ncbi:phosphatase PAP2 family protein [Candidatus Saccharibacteria bacterium]|nr:phosphatase PAP2 family protein [Candidatus Saccharibacteria bacterium]
MNELIKIIAEYVIVLSVLGFGLLLYRVDPKIRKAIILHVIAGGIITLVLAKIGSHLYNNPRPFVQGNFVPLFGHSRTNGFPSDHTLLSGLLAFTALYYSRKIGIILLLIAIAVGGARMAASVHHLSDIVGALVFAALGSFIAKLLVDKYFAKKSNTIRNPERQRK